MMIKKRINEHVKFITSLFLAAIFIFAMVPRLTTATAADSDGNRIIVSLGDSYSSGEGITPFYGQDDPVPVKVKNQDWLAHRSQNSWPGMLTLENDDGETVKMSEHRDTNWYFAATSGAETKHLESEFKKFYYKDWEYTLGAGIPFVGFKKIDAQLDIFNNIEHGTVDYVTITIGGNDAGFAKIIQDAVLGSIQLNFSSLQKNINKVWAEFYKKDGIRDHIRQAYEAIEDRAGKQAHIIVAGYPQLLNPEGSPHVFSPEEAEIINNAVSNFNDAIEQIVHSCKMAGMNISFVDVEEAFKDHEAYTDNPYINSLIPLAQSEDLNDLDIKSAGSIHPNIYGARAYAKCVQDRIDELEKNPEQNNKHDTMTSDERDVVLVLDVSGSMSGTPLDETKKASVNFINTVLKEDASIGIVTYDNTANMLTDFNMDEDYLTTAVEGIGAGGGTNIEAGLKLAKEMLDDSKAQKKIIVLMSDGEPNDGKRGDDLVSYADSIKKDDIYIYTLGFFESLGSGRSAAQSLMEKIATSGCHYEVADADDLVFFFGDIADQINGGRYIYVRIACPVDVTVSYDGETLTSSEKKFNTRTSFGSLTLEDSEDGDDKIKTLRLKDGVDYDIKIEGTGKGKMDYTIGYMDDTGEYSDLRRFKNVEITKRTVIDTTTKYSSNTVLNVDEDGDGKYDLKYSAGENGYGEIVDYTYILYIVLGVVGVIAVITLYVIIKKKIKKSKKRKVA